MSRQRNWKKKKRKKTAITKVRAHCEQSSTADDLCSQCRPAKCCMYFSLEIDPPENKRDYDDFLWFLAHENVSLYLWDGDWYLMVHNKCKYLDLESNLCTIYDTRPKMCREHETEDCEFDSDYEFDEHFKTYDELKQWMKKKKIIK